MIGSESHRSVLVPEVIAWFIHAFSDGRKHMREPLDSHVSRFDASVPSHVVAICPFWINVEFPSGFEVNLKVGLNAAGMESGISR
jgi:hypothetical protein